MKNQVYKAEGTLLETKENLFFTQSISNMEKAIKAGEILEGHAYVCDINKNLWINFNGFRGFIPKEECVYLESEKENSDIAIITRVNKPVSFVPLEVCEIDGETVVKLSRKKAQQKALEYLLDKKCGDIIDATITHIEPFGAFCDIGCGIISLITIDAISVSRIPHPKERFYKGQKIKAVIKEIDRDYNRIYLSHKELLGTWEENAEMFMPGQTVSGIIRSVESYGIFVELAPNFAGLADLIPGVYEGQLASVYIKSIIPEKMKVKLTIVDSFDGEKQKPLNYYFINEGHIDYFKYSPECSGKVIETYFNN